MKKDLMYYVHKNRKDAWKKVVRASAKSGQDIIDIIKSYQVSPKTGIAYLREKGAQYKV